MPRRERLPPPPVPPIPAPFRHAYAGIGPSNIPVPSTPSSRSPNDNANSLRKAKSAVEMSSAYERKRRTALPPSKLRESVSANEATPTAPKARNLKIQQVPSAAESLGHPPRVQAAQAPVNEVNRSRLTTKKSLPNFSLKKPTSARSVDINNASASTREYYTEDVPGSARREFMGQRNDQQNDQPRRRDADAITPSQRSELNYEHALEKLGWLDRLKRKAMSAGKDSSGPDKRLDAPVNISTPTEPHKQPVAGTSGGARVDQQSSTPDVNANKSGKLPRWTESMKHVTGVGSLMKPKSPSVESGRTFLSQPSPLTSSSSDSLSTSRLIMEARKDPSPLERMQKANMQTGMPNRPSHLRGAVDVDAANSERDDPFVEASSTPSSTAPPTDANVLPWNYQKADGSFNAALLGAGSSSNALKYANAGASTGDFASSPETPYTPTRSSNQALRAAKSESSIKSTTSLGVINPPSKKSLEYSIENPDHMPHTHFYKAIQAVPSSPPPRALSPAEDPEWPRMVAQARRNIEMREQKAAQEAEAARIAALEKPEADERKARAEMEDRLIRRGSGFGMAPLRDFYKMTYDELGFYLQELTAELERMAAIVIAEEEAAARGDFRSIFKTGIPSEEQAELERVRFVNKAIFLRDQGCDVEKARAVAHRRETEEIEARRLRQIGETSRQTNVETPLSSSTAEAQTTAPPIAGPAPKPKDTHQKKAAKASPSSIPVPKTGPATTLSTPPKYTPGRAADKSTSFTPDTVKEERGKALRALHGPSPPSVVQNLPSNKKPVGLGIANAYGGQVGYADGAAAGPSINKGKGRALEPTPDSTPQVPRTQFDLGKSIERDRSYALSPVSSIHSDEARELESTSAHDKTRDHRVSLLSPLDQAPLKVAFRPVVEEGQGKAGPATTTFKVDRNENFKAMIAAEAAKRARMLNAPGAPIHPAFRQAAGDTGMQNVPSTEHLPSREGRGPLPMPAHPAFHTTGAGQEHPVAPATAPLEGITWFSEPLRTVGQPPTLPSTDQESLDGTTDTTSKPTAPTKSSGAPRVGSLVINTDRLFSPGEEYRSPLEDHAWFETAAKSPASVHDAPAHDASTTPFGGKEGSSEAQMDQSAQNQASKGGAKQAFGAQVPALPQMAEPDVLASAAQPPAIPPKSSKRTITSHRSGDQINTSALASIVEKDDSGSEWVQNTDYDPRGDPHHALFEEDWYPGKDSAEASSSVYSRDDKEPQFGETNKDEENESEAYGGMNINFDAEIQEIEEWTSPSSQRSNFNSPLTQGLSQANPDGLNALRADLDLAPLRLHDAASGQPKHPHHEFAFGTEKLMYYMKHNNLPGEGRAVSRCSTCARFCCAYAENLYASGLPTRNPGVEFIQQQAVKAVNRLDAMHPNGVETFDVFLSCAECSKVVCPQCVVVCEESFCREMLCGEHAVEGRCAYHGRS
ncbi:hypothetical protein KC315_g5562 [Hortaea werneckii]|nr:hypothetical protein KC315_g5562 [Hortaea werneckii]